VLADDAADLAAKLHRGLELAVLVAEEDEALHADRLAGGALLALARRRHLRRRHLRVVRALLAAREHAVRDVRALSGPGRDRPRAAEVDVVGVGEDGHRALGDDERIRRQR